MPKRQQEQAPVPRGVTGVPTDRPAGASPPKGVLLIAVLLGALLVAALGGAPLRQPALLLAALAGVAELFRQLRSARAVRGHRLDVRNAVANVVPTAPEDRQLAAIVHHGGDLLMIVNGDSAIQYASPSHEVSLGWPVAQLVGTPLLDRVHEEDQPVLRGALAQADGEPFPAATFLMRVSDDRATWRWLESRATPLPREPDVGGIVLASRDVTLRKSTEMQLLEQALMDPLTGLANRRLFSDRVTHALARRVRHPLDVAVLMLDLDHFKLVNDTLGHAQGDALLVAVADRLRGATRAADTVARLGGDEFAVLLEDLAHPQEAEASAARVLEALNAPIVLGDRTLYVRASVGVAWATEGQTVDELLTEADMAMYSAKSAGRGRVERFSAEMRATVAERLDVEAQLQRAIERNEFELVYQPVVDLVTGRISGAEALIRWRHPEQGVLLPLRFIAVAEGSDLIIAIGQFVLERAARDAAWFRALSEENARLRVSVNISARHLLSPSILEDVSRALHSAGLDGNAIAIELTEGVLAESPAQVIGNLQALRTLGVRVALDDFGTGYSSLSQLRQFPIDVLKVDRSFVGRSMSSPSEDGVTKAIVSIGHSLRIRTVAEGIETREQLREMCALGCSLGQGFLFSPPLEREAMASLLRSWDAARFANTKPVTLGFGMERVPGVTNEIDRKQARRMAAMRSALQ